MTTIPAVSLTIDAVPVLEQHRFPEDRLEHYLCQHVEGFTARSGETLCDAQEAAG